MTSERSNAAVGRSDYASPFIFTPPRKSCFAAPKSKKPRICVAQAQAANPLYLASQKGFDKYEPITASQTEASAIRIGKPLRWADLPKGEA